MSAKYVINQIHRFNFLAVNDFRVNLRSLYVGMAEQFARGIKIRTEGKHHCGERVAGHVVNTSLSKRKRNIGGNMVTGCELVVFLCSATDRDRQNSMGY